MEMTAEQFLKKKLESEISTFGNGIAEFHTVDLEHLLKCLDAKDQTIKQNNEVIKALSDRIDFNAEKKFYELLKICMTINNMSSSERLCFIRSRYNDIWEKLNLNK